MGSAKRPCHPTETVGCDNEIDQSKKCKPNNTLIEFRPHRRYEGEFGFDWLRVQDISGTTIPYVQQQQVLNEPPYKDCLIGSEVSGHAWQANPPNPNLHLETAYNDLKAIYDALPVNRKEGYKDNYNNGQYFIPFLNLYPKGVSETLATDYRTNHGQAIPVKPPYEAKLRLFANVRGTKPEKVTIEFENEFFNIVYGTNQTDRTHKIDDDGNEVADTQTTLKSHYIINDGVWFNPDNPDGKNKEGMDDITIICLNEFPAKKYIIAYAHYDGGKEKKLAGKLCICPNDAANRKILPMVLVRVRTNVLRTPADRKTGALDNIERDSLYHGLYQSLISPDITNKVIKTIRGRQTPEDIILNLTSDPNFWDEKTDPTTGAVIRARGKFIDFTRNLVLGDSAIPDDYQGTHIYLKNKYDTNTNNIHVARFPIFVFDLPADGGSLFGVVQDIGIKNVILTQLTSPERRSDCPFTCAHETYHGLGVHHTHLHEFNETLSVDARFVYYGADDANYDPNIHSEEKSTDNLMSYKTVTYSTWSWQWELAKRHV